jgi:SH3-like domain-containing protein
LEVGGGPRQGDRIVDNTLMEIGPGANRMRWRFLGAVLLAACSAQPAAAEEFPYVAYVNTDDVYVRSGPGRNYYPTDKQRRGARVEVYRHDPGGWLAIRPPRASFAWVQKRHLDPETDRLASVNSDRVVARVGSRFSEVRDVIQVRLEKGEKVELLAAPRDDSPWCKIAPPAGEFRWVFSKYVDRELPSDLAADAREAERSHDAISRRDEPDDDPGVHLASSQSDAGSADTADDPRTSAGTRSRPALDRRSTVGRQLTRLEVELSVMVAEDISAWSFGDLQRRAEDVLKQAQTPVERGQARILMSKLERFADIGARHQALRRPPGETGPGNVPVRTTQPAGRDMDQFDGVGRLSPVISDKVGGPQYALVDDANAVISFITPAPGVNLRPYVDRHIGVSGQRGYMTDLQRQHISVQRVTVLDVTRK